MRYATIQIHTSQPKTLATGYEVQLFNGQIMVDSHLAGANPHDSHQPGISTTAQVRKWARQTAKEMFLSSFGYQPKRNQIEIEEQAES
jgi:hypothetical protein